MLEEHKDKAKKAALEKKIKDLEERERRAVKRKEQFEEAGGEHYIHIPCLNDRDDWAGLMAQWINEWKENETLPEYNVK